MHLLEVTAAGVHAAVRWRMCNTEVNSSASPVTVLMEDKESKGSQATICAGTAGVLSSCVSYASNSPTT